LFVSSLDKASLTAKVIHFKSATNEGEEEREREREREPERERERKKERELGTHLIHLNLCQQEVRFVTNDVDDATAWTDSALQWWRAACVVGGRVVKNKLIWQEFQVSSVSSC
jgi:hypothetical protein